MGQITSMERTEFAKELDDILHTKDVREGTFIVNLKADFYNCTVYMDKVQMVYVLEHKGKWREGITFFKPGSSFSIDFDDILSAECEKEEWDEYPYLYLIETTDGSVCISIVLD